MEISTALTQPLSTLIARIDFVLDSLGYRVARRDTVAGMWVTAPRYSWPLGADTEAWHGPTHPGLRAYVFVQDDSGHRSLVVATQVLCNLHDQTTADQPGSVESTLRVLSSGQIMVGVSAAFSKAAR